MKRAALLLASALALSAPLELQAQQTTGWQGARWGMTLEEVLKAHPGSDETSGADDTCPPGESILAYAQHQAGHRLFAVYFCFDEAGKLASIRMDTRKALKTDRDLLPDMLRTYGRPDATDKVDRTERTFWTSGDNQVVLELTTNFNGELSFGKIFYRPRGRASGTGL